MEQRSVQRKGRKESGSISRVSAHSISRADTFEDENEEAWPSRLPRSMRRYHSDVKSEVGRTIPDVRTLAQRDQRISSEAGRRNTLPGVPPRRTAQIPVAQNGRRAPVDTEEVFPQRQQKKGHRGRWLIYCVMMMLVMMGGWMLLTSAFKWWQIMQDDWHYGRPRTYQVDAIVGHNDSASRPSHFIALNLKRHVQIIEFPGGDSAKAKVYIGPVLIGEEQELTVVMLNFKDVNGDKRPDMIVNVKDSRFVFINEKDTFRPLRPGEQVQS